jgi:hypothetical protein
LLHQRREIEARGSGVGEGACLVKDNGPVVFSVAVSQSFPDLLAGVGPVFTHNKPVPVLARLFLGKPVIETTVEPTRYFIDRSTDLRVCRIVALDVDDEDTLTLLVFQDPIANEVRLSTARLRNDSVVRGIARNPEAANTTVNFIPRDVRNCRIYFLTPRW